MPPDTRNIQCFIRDLGRPVFTTHEAVAVSGRSASTVVQCLGRLARQGLLLKPCRGVWADPGRGDVSAFTIIPQLFPRQRVYVSFITALHLHGIVAQIPQVFTLASLGHSRTLRTSFGTYSVHQLAPEFFDGFDWHRGDGSFLVAGPEKALVDSLYLSSRRKKQFAHFPELDFSGGFSFRTAEQWARRIPAEPIRRYVLGRLAVFRVG